MSRIWPIEYSAASQRGAVLTPDEMAPAERLEELAGILAEGLVRARLRGLRARHADGRKAEKLALTVPPARASMSSNPL